MLLEAVEFVETVSFTQFHDKTALIFGAPPPPIIFFFAVTDGLSGAAP